MINAERWRAARQVIRAELRSSPNGHWLLTRLGLTYYEEKRYKQSLRYTARALEEMPNCPLVLWDYAGDLEMLGQTKRALDIYR
ncbi:MAG TPA: tetratricopeptide repeat protein, partial [Bryobacteraceae bacterium]|nr:tetratricopeptide repeat protein [Bryobacteraceae bacterium]